MVTFITILQVNMVISLLLYLMFLVYLYGIQTPSSDQHKPTKDPVNSLIFRLYDIVRNNVRHSPDRDEETLDDAARPALHLQDYLEGVAAAYQPVIDIGWEAVKHKGYNSPRVLLSDKPPLEPPPPYFMDDFVDELHASNRTRNKRQSEHQGYRGEYSVCDSESQWVTDKTSATDIRGREVAVLNAIKTGDFDVRQYFYETRCRRARPTRGGCRGIDDKYWNSQCKTAQTFVRALTSDQASVGWRWIRINTSCVCALSRKQRRT